MYGFWREVYNKSLALAIAWREMIRQQAARSPPAARRPQCAVKWDRNLKPKIAIMHQCTSVTDRRTLHHSISARCIYYYVSR